MEYKSNSNKSKEEKKVINKAVTGKVRKKKKSEFRKLTDVFISEDVDDVKSYILMDVLVPAVKKALSDIVVNGIDMLLYGETGHSKKKNSSRISYRSYYDDRPTGRRETRSRYGYDYDDIVLDNRGEAEDVLSRMDDLLDQYGMVSVADLYDLVGVNGNYTDNDYGWTNLRSASVVRCRDGYMLKLPKALPLK